MNGWISYSQKCLSIPGHTWVYIAPKLYLVVLFLYNLFSVSFVYYLQLQVDIFKDTNVTCDGGCWARAKRTTSAWQYVRILLVGVFDQATLLQSLLKSGSSKRATWGAAPTRQALDERKVEAIYSKSYFLLTF